MSDDDDDWSYSFPPSRDSFSDPPKETVPLDAVSGLLATQLQSDPNSRTHAASTSMDSKITIPDDSVLNSLSTDPPPDSSTTNTASLFMNSNHGSQSAGLQAAFKPKSAPANPQTTMKDANSIISKESTNALANAEISDLSPPLTPASDFRNSIRIWQQKQQQQSSLEDLRGGDDVYPGSPLYQEQFDATSPTSQDVENGDGPKVIAYRKGSNRRKQSASYHALDTDDKFDPRLYVEEKYKDTNYHYTTMQRNVDFHQIFKSLDLTDRLIDDFACALSKEILLQGRIYITEHCVGFNSNLLGWVTTVVIPFEDITRIDKKSTAGLFPNGIQIETADSKHNFASFISRDSTYDLIRTVWSASTGKDVAELNKNHTNPDVKFVGANQQISEYILSIDEDASETRAQAAEGERNSTDEKKGTPSAQIRKLKPNSAYGNPGPDTRGPTTITGEYEDSQDETEVINETIECPLGLVFEILFGRDNPAFHRQVLEDQGATEVSDYGDFHNSEKSEFLERSYSYRRPLGYSLGPKSTKCNVVEHIEKCDFDSCVVVLSTTVTPDVPSGGSFSVRTRYYLTWGNDGSTNLRIAFYVKWTGRSWIRNVVEKSTLAAQTTVNRNIVDSLKQEVEKNTQLSEASAEELEKVTVVEEPQQVIPESPQILPAVNEAAQISEKSSQWSVLAFGLVLTLLCFVLYLQIRLYGTVFETKKILTKQLELISNLSELLVENENAPWWNKVFAEGKDSRKRERAIFLAKQALLLLEGSQEKSLRATLEEVL